MFSESVYIYTNINAVSNYLNIVIWAGCSSKNINENWEFDIAEGET